MYPINVLTLLLYFCLTVSSYHIVLARYMCISIYLLQHSFDHHANQSIFTPRPVWPKGIVVPSAVCRSVRPSVHSCERHNSTRNIQIAFKLHIDVPRFKISDELDLHLSMTSLTFPIGPRSTFLVNAITPQEMSQSLSNFTQMFLRSKSRTSFILNFL